MIRKRRHVLRLRSVRDQSSLSVIVLVGEFLNLAQALAIGLFARFGDFGFLLGFICKDEAVGKGVAVGHADLIA